MRSYDNFVRYYHQFIQQLVNLLGNSIIFIVFILIFVCLEISKPDQIIPAIKMLKLLADRKRQYQSNSKSLLINEFNEK